MYITAMKSDNVHGVKTFNFMYARQLERLLLPKLISAYILMYMYIII